MKMIQAKAIIGPDSESNSNLGFDEDERQFHVLESSVNLFFCNLFEECENVLKEELSRISLKYKAKVGNSKDKPLRQKRDEKRKTVNGHISENQFHSCAHQDQNVFMVNTETSSVGLHIDLQHQGRKKSPSLVSRKRSRKSALPKFERELGSIIAFVYALVAASEGSWNLETNRFLDVKKRMKTADDFAQREDEWIGTKLVRANFMLMNGLSHILHNHFAQGGFCVFRAWKRIKTLHREALNYSGHGKRKEIIRSLSLMSMGILDILGSFVANQYGHVAKLCGFSSDRNRGLATLFQCMNEGGIFGVSWTYYQLETKRVTGEDVSENDFKQLTYTFTWAHNHFPKSVHFKLLESDLYKCRRQIDTAKRFHEQAATNTKDELMVSWIINYKRGLYCWASMQWLEAATAFEACVAACKTQGKKSTIPYLSALSLISLLQAKSLSSIDTMLNQKIKANLDILQDYAVLPKLNWSRQDLLGFRLFSKYAVDDSNMHNWVLLDILEVMVTQLRCTEWMEPGMLNTFLRTLSRELDRRAQSNTLSLEQRISSVLFRTDILINMDRPREALSVANPCIQNEQILAYARMVKTPIIPFLLFLVAQLYAQKNQISQAKVLLRKLKSLGKEYRLYHHLRIKVDVLTQRMKVAS